MKIIKTPLVLSTLLITSLLTACGGDSDDAGSDIDGDAGKKIQAQGLNGLWVLNTQYTDHYTYETGVADAEPATEIGKGGERVFVRVSYTDDSETAIKWEDCSGVETYLISGTKLVMEGLNESNLDISLVDDNEMVGSFDAMDEDVYSSWRFNGDLKAYKVSEDHNATIGSVEYSMNNNGSSTSASSTLACYTEDNGTYTNSESASGNFDELVVMAKVADGTEFTLSQSSDNWMSYDVSNPTVGTAYFEDYNNGILTLSSGSGKISDPDNKLDFSAQYQLNF